MNFKNTAIRELSEFAKQFPDYSLGEVLYSALRAAGVKEVKQLLTKTDEELFTAFNGAIENEKDVTI